MYTKRLSLGIILSTQLLLNVPSIFASMPNDQAQQPSADMSTKIQAFLDKESKNISETAPFFLRLFKDGVKASNPAGLRISESTKQFAGLNKFPAEGLTGLLFYYQLYNEAQRVPHWHANAVEVGVVLTGKMKITIWEGFGRASEFTVPKGGAWMIPQGSIHCLENASEEQLNFLVAYNNPNAEDRDFSTAWSALPETILAKSLGLSTEEIALFKKNPSNRLSSYDPGDVVPQKDLPSEFRSAFADVKPIYESPLGSLSRLDETNWKANTFMALQQTILKPGTIREPHWYRGSDAFLFVQQGSAYFNMMDGEGNVYNLMLQEGDLVFIPMGAFHSYVSVGDKDLTVYESFLTSQEFSEIGIQEATSHFRPGIIAGAMGLKLDVVQKIPKTRTPVYMRSL
jgi:oxalate decarboxylase